jgi:glutathione-independent formaldehyde dehydrogenase
MTSTLAETNSSELAGTVNRTLVATKEGGVRIEERDYSGLVLRSGPGYNPARAGETVTHGVVIKPVTTCICGSDQHLLGAVPDGTAMGHELTGIVVEAGDAVQFTKVGELVSVAMNTSCGLCDFCKIQQTNHCVNTRHYLTTGLGAQADYVLVPWADWNVLKFPDAEKAMDLILDLSLLSDILPTGYHGAVVAGVTTGCTVYVAGAGPVGLAAAASARYLGASEVIIGDMNEDRLALARRHGFGGINVTAGPLPDQLIELIGAPHVDATIDAVGSVVHGGSPEPRSAAVLNSLISATAPGGRIGIPGYYANTLPGGSAGAHQTGQFGLAFGAAWARGVSLNPSVVPVAKYQPPLMRAILSGRLKIADIVNAQVIGLEDAVDAYADFGAGAATKYVLDPHGLTRK